MCQKGGALIRIGCDDAVTRKRKREPWRNVIYFPIFAETLEQTLLYYWKCNFTMTPSYFCFPPRVIPYRTRLGRRLPRPGPRTFSGATTLPGPTRKCPGDTTKVGFKPIPALEKRMNKTERKIKCGMAGTRSISITDHFHYPFLPFLAPYLLPSLGPVTVTPPESLRVTIF